MQTITITADDDPGEIEEHTLASGTIVYTIDGGPAVHIEYIAPCSFCDGYGHGPDPDVAPGCPAYWRG